MIDSFSSDSSLVDVVIFSGGRGTNTITRSLHKYKNIRMTILINGYDDGLSTGRVRKFIPGMLGPSDFRKNYSRLLSYSQKLSDNCLAELLELRLTSDENETLDDLLKISQKKYQNFTNPLIENLFSNLTISCAYKISKAINDFINYFDKTDKSLFSFIDMSLGNLIFTGIYLNHHDFNGALKEFTQISKIKHNILNITDGECLVLTAITKSNKFIQDEASIVNNQFKSKIDEIYLLTNEKLNTIKRDKVTKKILQKEKALPLICKEAQISLSTADIIVYGPGTQNSSLFPSYLTQGVCESISENLAAEKIFISNVAKDKDIIFETANSLFTSFYHYMTRYNTVKDEFRNTEKLVTSLFFQDDLHGDNERLLFNATEFTVPPEKICLVDFSDEHGKHSGSKTLLTLLENIRPSLRERIGNASHKVSIIVPGLNEKLTIQKILEDLLSYDSRKFNLDMEIIYVDGGSTDGTYEIASKVSGVKSYQLAKNIKGKGAALKHGINYSSGDLILFFPSDAEYKITDIDPVVYQLLNNNFNAVVGSRAYGITDLNLPLKIIYQKKLIHYYLSKIGGVLISLMFLFCYRRFLSDPLSGIKGFNRKLFQHAHFKCNGFDFDTEIISYCMKKKNIVLEVPIRHYMPRRYDHGKKIRAIDGIMCLLSVIRVKLRKC
jgi:2-phospho-L-lactate transferase/gluconeogenesis factor (CofD/UPF0052 family)